MKKYFGIVIITFLSYLNLGAKQIFDQIVICSLPNNFGYILPSVGSDSVKYVVYKNNIVIDNAKTTFYSTTITDPEDLLLVANIYKNNQIDTFTLNIKVPVLPTVNFESYFLQDTICAGSEIKLKTRGTNIIRSKWFVNNSLLDSNSTLSKDLILSDTGLKTIKLVVFNQCNQSQTTTHNVFVTKSSKGKPKPFFTLFLSYVDVRKGMLFGKYKGDTVLTEPIYDAQFDFDNYQIITNNKSIFHYGDGTSTTLPTTRKRYNNGFYQPYLMSTNGCGTTITKEKLLVQDQIGLVDKDIKIISRKYLTVDDTLKCEYEGNDSIYKIDTNEHVHYIGRINKTYLFTFSNDTAYHRIKFHIKDKYTENYDSVKVELGVYERFFVGSTQVNFKQTSYCLGDTISARLENRSEYDSYFYVTSEDTNRQYSTEIKVVPKNTGIFTINVVVGRQYRGGYPYEFTILNNIPFQGWEIGTNKKTSTINSQIAFSILNHDGKINSVTWEFSDNTKMYGKNISKSFAVSGLQSVKCIVKTNCGESVKYYQINIEKCLPIGVQCYYSSFINLCSGKELSMYANHINADSVGYKSNNKIIWFPTSFADIRFKAVFNQSDTLVYIYAKNSCNKDSVRLRLPLTAKPKSMFSYSSDGFGNYRFTNRSINTSHFVWYANGLIQSVDSKLDIKNNPTQNTKIALVAYSASCSDTMYYTILKNNNDVIPEDTTGLFEINELNKSVNIYPNPATDKISVNSILIVKSYAIYSIIGDFKFTQKVQLNDFDINIKHLSVGVYLMNLEFSDGSRKVIKFIVQ